MENSYDLVCDMMTHTHLCHFSDHRQVLQQVQKTGGRFLKKDYEADIWVEVNDVIAREKVCQVSLCGSVLTVSSSIIKYLTLNVHLHL